MPFETACERMGGTVRETSSVLYRLSHLEEMQNTDEILIRMDFGKRNDICKSGGSARTGQLPIPTDTDRRTNRNCCV